MKCRLISDIECPLEDVFGSCFFCNRVNEDYAVSKIPILETDLIHRMEEDL